MCGITGYLDLEKGIDTSIVRSMNQRIKHRGPDDEGYAFIGTDNSIEAYGDDSLSLIKSNGYYVPVDSIIGNQYFLALGYRRLSILDTSVLGHQPMFNPDTNNHVVFNGEIYNFIELRKELEECGYHFRSNCDTEVLLNAYEQWGEDCVKHFNGMWAFALWDAKKKQLILSRDRLGVKPLYYFLSRNKMLFGSELKQLTLDNSISHYLNEEVLAANLIYGLSDYDNETLIKNFFVLEAATNLVIQIEPDENKFHVIKKYKYWDLKINMEQCSEEQAIKIFDRQFNRSIAYRMRSDVKVGALLSGGLDSSSLVTLISRGLEDEKEKAVLDTFTSCYDNTVHDEKKYAEIINDFNHCHAHYINPKPRDVKNELERLVWHMESITAPAILGFLQVLEAVADTEVKVVLNGQNGDETLFGYERYYAFYFLQLLKKGKIKRAVWEFKQAVKNSRLSFFDMVKYSLYFNVPLVRDTRNKVNAGKVLTKRLRTSLNDKSFHNKLYPKNMENLLYNELTSTQLPHILKMDDKGYMAFSLESRVPFCDYEYVESMVNIRPEIKMKNGFTKYILRRYMDDKMPREVTWRKNKLGFSAPTEWWTEKIDPEYMNHLFEENRSGKVFDITKVRKRYRKYGAGDKFVFNFIQLEIFMRQFDVEVV